jgi:hypothetical protein
MKLTDAGALDLMPTVNLISVLTWPLGVAVQMYHQ